MKLTDNPILNTHAVLAKRQGLHLVGLVVAAVCVLLAWAYVMELDKLRSYVPYDPQRVVRHASESLVGIVVVQALIAALGAVMIARTIATHRAKGLLDANRLTPMSPRDLAAGYWLGPLLPALGLMAIGTVFCFFIAAVTPGCGFEPVLQSQGVLFGAALIGGLVSALIALEVRNPGHALPLVLLCSVALPFSMALGQHFVGTYILGAPAITEVATQRGYNPGLRPTLFGLSVDAFLLAVGLQAITVLVVWKGLVAKLTDPHGRGIRRGHALAAFTALLTVQHALSYGPLSASTDRWIADEFLLGVYMFSLIGAIVIALSASLSRRELRRGVLRQNQTATGIGWRGGVPTTLAASLIGGAFLALHSSHLSIGDWVIAAGDLVASTLVVAAALEAGRLNGDRRRRTLAGIFVATAIFAPVLAGIIVDEDLAVLALGVTGAAFIGGGNYLDVELGCTGLVLHSILAGVAVFHWRHELARSVHRVKSTTT